MDKLFCIISGVLTAIAFNFTDYNFLVWFSLAPCFYVLFKNINLGDSFINMFVYGISFYSILFLFLWKLYPLDWRGFNNFQSFLIVLVAWAVLSIFEALFIGILGILWFGINKLIKSKWITLTLLWIILEWCQGLGYTGFTWGRLANCQYNNSYIIQSASIFGSLFVSAIIVLANSFIACYFHNKTKYIYIIAFFIVFGLNFSYGYYRIKNIEIPNNTIKASVIQANIDSVQKWNSNSINNILDTYITLTRIADNNSNEDLDVVIWAETALPIVLLNETEILAKCYELANSINSTLLIGAFEEIDGKSYNSIFKISPSTDIEANIQTYQKQHIVPFGEYLPFRDILQQILPFLKDIMASSNDISVGKNIDGFEIENAKIANLICFDSIFPKTAREQALNGAEVIAIETNDAWFNKSTAINQHLSQAVMRAVENNRYVMRSANTGISAFISSTGEILSALKPEVTGYINYEIPLIQAKTIYTEFGDIIVFISALLLIFISFIVTAFELIFDPFLSKLSFFVKMLKK